MATQPWVEKYRPQVLSDVVGNEETIAKLQSVVNGGNMPNIILSGPPGTGKTTTMLCLARQMLGDLAKEAVLELNASDERGIAVVRDKIKMFAKKRVNLPAGCHKLVILDEADSMTQGAQQAMRRTMELFSSTTRFALACNTSSKISEPIQSRCAILRFTRLTDAHLLQRLQTVCAAEGVTATDGGLEALIFTAEGDMRNALNNLQSTHSGFNVVDETTVFKVCDQPHPHVARSILEACLSADLEAALAALRKLFDSGYAAVDIIGTLFKVVKYHKMAEPKQLEFIKEIGFTHTRIVDGSATLVQLTGLVARLVQLADAPGAAN
mmetsp:Transcript_29198/g.87304  ORF Transcript_29198/g.87304 Transcript_29198/m.87304 type:complete len:324 (-) Transcript_29198:24-995(-)